MRMKVKILLILQFLVIIGLSVLVFSLSSPKIDPEAHYRNSNYSLLSSRISYDILQPNNYLILNYDPLEKELSALIKENHLNVSIYVENIRDGASFGVNSEQTYLTGSMGKLPVAILIMKQIERGNFTLHTNFTVLDTDKDSYSGTLYAENATEASVSFLLEAMLQNSDNTALHVLERHTNPSDYITLLEQYYGYYDGTLPTETTPNVINPLTVYTIYSSLFLSTILSADHSEYLLEILSNTTFPIHELADIPENITITQKYGTRYDGDNKYFHDCGIIYAHETRVFYCVMTKDLDPDTASEIIGILVNKVYSYTVEQRKILDEYETNLPS